MSERETSSSSVYALTSAKKIGRERERENFNNVFVVCDSIKIIT